MRWTEDVWLWLAFRMPRKLVYWCAVRVAAYATSGRYEHQIVPELRATDALKRWELQ